MKPMLSVSLGLGLGVLAVMVLVALSGCELARPFRGPGYVNEQVAVDDLDQKLLVALTHGKVSAGRKSDFSDATDAVLDSMEDAEGLIGYSVRKELFGDQVWTMSVWRDEESLGEFMRSRAHRSAVRGASIERKNAVTTQVWIPAREIPLSWDRAKALLAKGRSGGEEGRTSEGE